MDLKIVFLIAMVGVLVGFVVGLLMNRLREGRGRTKSRGTEESRLEDKYEVRLSRNQHNRNLILEMGGKAYHKEGDLMAEQRRVLNQLALDLFAWLGMPVMRQEEPFTSSSPIQEERAYTPEEPSPEMTTEKRSLFDSFIQAIQADARISPTPPLSIAAQIDTILQEKLKGSPLEERAIRIMELPEKGMVVMIGLDQYEDIDAIPDGKIKAIIRDSVAEWEEQIADEGE